MDSILIVGSQDVKFTGFLKKAGYEVVEFDGSRPLADFIERQVLDLVVIDTKIDLDSSELCQFLRAHEPTKNVPIVCLANGAVARHELKELGLQRIEIFDHPYQIGRVVSAIATQLRLTKTAGKDERTASLLEVNAALRDLNARFQKELQEAQSIQHALLPQDLPADPRYDVSFLYQPLEEVGGDWYFIEPCADGTVAMQIADVTGHGLGAAFVGSMTKLAMTACPTRAPAELLTTMNRLMAPQLPPGRFVTMESLRYDPSTGAVEHARAGHPPALHFSLRSGEIAELKSEGFPVGFFPDSEYSSGSATLAPGDLLVLVTDGVTEVQNRAFETYGMSRLADAIRSNPPDAPASAVRDSILASITEFREGRIIKDDVTLVVLRHRGG